MLTAWNQKLPFLQLMTFYSKMYENCWKSWYCPLNGMWSTHSLVKINNRTCTIYNFLKYTSILLNGALQIQTVWEKLAYLLMKHVVANKNIILLNNTGSDKIYLLCNIPNINLNSNITALKILFSCCCHSLEVLSNYKEKRIMLEISFRHIF